MNTGRHMTATITLLATLATAGCSTTKDAVEANDPLESYNRAVFTANDALDRGVVEPVARGYRAAVPHPIRMSLRNFLRNLRTPVNAANQLLQGDIEGMASDISRAVINTSIGIGGLFDVAETAGLKYEQEDFGQTLAVWGVGHGPYFVLPVLGPSSIRDTAGFAVDTVADPVRIYLHNTDKDGWSLARAGASGIDKREELLDALEDLRKNSFDYYAAMRSAYYQKRESLVNDDNGVADIPDYSAGEE